MSTRRGAIRTRGFGRRSGTGRRLSAPSVARPTSHGTVLSTAIDRPGARTGLAANAGASCATVGTIDVRFAESLSRNGILISPFTRNGNSPRSRLPGWQGGDVGAPGHGRRPLGALGAETAQRGEGDACSGKASTGGKEFCFEHALDRRKATVAIGGAPAAQQPPSSNAGRFPWASGRVVPQMNA